MNTKIKYVYQTQIYIFILEYCGGNAKSWLKAVIEHLVGRQGQARGAQVHATDLNDWKCWSQDPSLPRPHLKVGSGGKSILLEMAAYLRLSVGKDIVFFFVVVGLFVCFLFLCP